MMCTVISEAAQFVNNPNPILLIVWAPTTGYIQINPSNLKIKNNEWTELEVKISRSPFRQKLEITAQGNASLICHFVLCCLMFVGPTILHFSHTGRIYVILVQVDE